MTDPMPALTNSTIVAAYREKTPSSERLAALGADEDAARRAARANTAMEVLQLSEGLDLPLADAIAAGAREVVLATLSGGTEVEVLVVARDGRIAGRAGAFQE